jgi:hypothetical protein
MTVSRRKCLTPWLRPDHHTSWPRNRSPLGAPGAESYLSTLSCSLMRLRRARWYTQLFEVTGGVLTTAPVMCLQELPGTMPANGEVAIFLSCLTPAARLPSTLFQLRSAATPSSVPTRGTGRDTNNLQPTIPLEAPQMLPMTPQSFTQTGALRDTGSAVVGTRGSLQALLCSWGRKA